MPDAKELSSILRSMRNDPDMRDFYPVINEMLSGLEVPDYDNIETVLKLFTENDLKFHCNQLARSLYIHSNMTMPRKRWYEYELDD